MKHICKTNFVGFLTRSENSGHKFVLTSADAFLKELSKEFMILDIYKNFKRDYKEKIEKEDKIYEEL